MLYAISGKDHFCQISRYLFYLKLQCLLSDHGSNELLKPFGAAKNPSHSGDGMNMNFRNSKLGRKENSNVKTKT